MSEPTTEAGKRDHDLGWSDLTSDHEQSIGDHQWERVGCRSCAGIARIEAEARQQGAAAERERVRKYLWTLPTYSIPTGDYIDRDALSDWLLADPEPTPEGAGE